jgi:hypothetical protein
MQYTLNLENDGRLVLSEEVLRRVNLKQSDRVSIMSSFCNSPLILPAIHNMSPDT